VLTVTLCEDGYLTMNNCFYFSCVFQIQQSVLGDEHLTVKSTLDSIAFVETVREGPLQAATNNLLQGASAVCNAGSSSNVAEMLGFEAFDSSSPLQWFQNSCGALFEDDEKDLKIMKIKKKKRVSARSKSSGSIILNDERKGSTEKPNNDSQSPRYAPGSSLPSSSSVSSQSTPTSLPPEISTAVIQPPSTTTKETATATAKA
jgi:hypothetical protein